MRKDTATYLSNTAAQQMSRLEYQTRQAMSGFVSGRHVSPCKGQSVEFAEHRLYSAGDDIKCLDWTVYAKTDRYFIKEFIEETNTRATIILDSSASMRYQGNESFSVDGNHLSKYEYGIHLAAALSYMLMTQQDAFGLLLFEKEITSFFPPKSGASQLRLIMNALSENVPNGEGKLSEVLHEAAERLPNRGLIFIISDFFSDISETVKALHHLRYKNNEVVLFQLLAEEEITFPFKSFCDFEDLEGIFDSRQIDPESIRVEYLERMEKHLQALEKGCGETKVNYVPIITSTDYIKSLSSFVAGRGKV